MKNIIHRFIDDETAAGAVEYALVLLLILATITLVASSLKLQISGLMTTLGVKLSSGTNIIS